MAFCSNCGAQVQGAFCMRCGSPVAQQPSAPPPQQPYPQPPYTQPQYTQQPPYAPPPAPAKADMDQNVAAALCYLFGLVSGVVFLVLEPYNKDKVIRFHAFQSIFFNVSGIVLNIALTIAFSIMRSILPYGMWALFSLLSVLIFFAFFGAWAFLMYKAYNREMFKLPIIGDLAEKQA